MRLFEAGTVVILMILYWPNGSIHSVQEIRPFGDPTLGECQRLLEQTDKELKEREKTLPIELRSESKCVIKKD